MIRKKIKKMLIDPKLRKTLINKVIPTIKKEMKKRNSRK